MDQPSQIKITFKDTGHFFYFAIPPPLLPDGWTYNHEMRQRPSSTRSVIDHVATFSGPYATFETADRLIGSWATRIRGRFDRETQIPRLANINNFSNNNYAPPNNTNNIANSNNVMNVPKNSMNAILFTPIEDGTRMVNFHGERNFGRYYTANAYNALPKPKRNPQTRRVIQKQNVRPYRAHVVGGGKRSRRSSRRR